MALLSQIRSPKDVKELDIDELKRLAAEIREEIINVTSVNGGHLGPNLGVVELTLALHYVFDTPEDNFVFDVSHQGYVHKLLTGRQGDDFKKIRMTDGYSGFLAREESEHDCYGAGHAGTALSAAVGMAYARDQRGGDEHVVAICGDAAFTCGITFEALNNISQSTKRLIIILNDNEWSIDKNVGAISGYLNRLLTNPVYNKINEDLAQFVERFPGGVSFRKSVSKAKKETKDMFLESSLFEEFGLRYFGPIDGHDLKNLIAYLQFCKKQDMPVILHAITKKGKGCNIALDEPEKFHGTSPFDLQTGGSRSKGGPTPPKYQDVFGKAVLKHAQKDKRVIGITGAMPSGTGLSLLRDKLNAQYMDVGIAEEHAVLFAAGAATKGLKPVCAIYSTFLQRAFDPVVHDVCLQNLDVLFCMDRGGLSPNDGPTHHGIFDISYLRCIPNTILMQPADEDELCDMIATGLDFEGPCFIRYPRGSGTGVAIKDQPELLQIGTAQKVKEGTEIVIWALGPMLKKAKLLANMLESQFAVSVAVTNARFAKPLDSELLLEQSKKAKLVVTLEDHVISGGFGTAVMEQLQEAGYSTAVCRIGWPDQFIPHASDNQTLEKQYGLDENSIFDKVIHHPALVSMKERESESAISI